MRLATPLFALLLPVFLLPVLLSPAAAADAAQPATRIPQAALDTAAQLRTTALADNTGWQVVESLTTEVGPRPGGSAADARAVAWAKAKFEALGFDKVWTEPVTFPNWERRSEHAEVLGPHSQALVVTALGGSPGGTVAGQVVRFPDLDSLQKVAPGSLKGKIAFIDFRMQRAQDGHGYGMGSRVRGAGPAAAVNAGAAAYLMRSASTSPNRFAHTGGTRFGKDQTPIPSAALSNPDADQLTRLLALDPSTEVRLALDCGWTGEYTSQNVIGEITGSTRPDEIVLIGGHLDSWDLGTGAIDDAAGIGISMAAAKLISDLPQHPARTIRVVAFANEERGLFGGFAYAKAHADELVKHAIVSESDFGAGRIYGFDAGVADYADDAVQQIAKALEPLGIEWRPGEGEPESDVGPYAGNGAAWAWLGHDGTHYFDLHHNADDTLDKIDPQALAQNVAAYAVFTYLAAQAEGDFGSSPERAQVRNRR